MKNTQKTLQTPSFFLGIDVGKADLYCHILTPEVRASERFDNTSKGIKKLATWLKSKANPDQISACLEQTGHYGMAVAKTLHAMDLCSLHLVNPRQIKAYGNQKLRRNKSDTADARLIAEFLKSEQANLMSWSPQSTENEQITELSRYAESITKDNAKLKTKCEAVSNPAILRSLKRRIKAQEKEIKDTRQRINKIINSKEELKTKSKLLISIPGIAETTSHLIIAEIPDIALFGNARQLAAWAGLTPQHYESGTSGRSTTPITKIGSAILRRGLFMPAMNARVFNPLLKTFADKLETNGKKPKQIIIAVMRKLLHQIYGILKSGEPFNPEKRGFISTPNPLKHQLKIN